MTAFAQAIKTFADKGQKAVNARRFRALIDDRLVDQIGGKKHLRHRWAALDQEPRDAPHRQLLQGIFDQWQAIREGFMSMKMSIQKERDAMERLWKAREKQLEKVLLNAAHVRGSIEGIAGMNSVDLNLLEDGDDDNLAH